jgi:DNA-binding CsgD family transcriptional regulator
MFAEVLAAAAMAEFLQGDGLPADTIRRAIGLEGADSDAPIEWRPTMILGMMLNWSGATSEARRRFDELHHQVLEAGDETSLPFLLAQMSESATWEGDYAAAIGHADEALATSLRTGQKPMQAAALYARALAEAHRGNLDEARISARTGLQLAEEVGSVVMMMWNQAVLGFIEISVDDPAAAHGHLAPLVAWREVVGIGEPGMLRFLPDEIEALVALGEQDRADALLVEYEADALRLERPWAQLAAARCRALHAAAGGDLAGAVDTLRLALDRHADAVQPFDRARAALVLGSIQRRTRRRKDARESLQAAQQILDTLGAGIWSAKAQRLTGRPSGRATDGGEKDLTPAERRVARVVAGGATNREAAARLFVTVRTVELHLTNVYRKLGIRSRTELAARMAADRRT